MTDDYSANAAQMRATTDPGESGTESLPTSLSGELERIRYAILESKRALNPALTYWYETPTPDIAQTDVGDISPDAAGMRTTEDPYPAAVESLATDLAEELYRLRYLIAQITGKTYWYVDPDASITSLTARLNTKGYLHGLTLANNAGDAEHDIDVAAGEAASDDAAALDRVVMATAGLTKRIDAAWDVGTNAGGLDAGSVANATWYYLFLIQRPDTGVVDAIFSTSATSPTMPTDYTKKRRIGAVLTDGSANLLGLVQSGDDFYWKDPPLDVDSGNNPGTNAATGTLTVPPLGVEAICNGIMNHNGDSNDGGVYVSSLDVNDEAGAINAAPLLTLCSFGSTTAGQFRVRCNTSRQYRYRLSYSGGNNTFRASTLGWVDRRGRMA